MRVLLPSFAALLVGGCVGPAPPTIAPVVQDRIAKCGGGLVISQDIVVEVRKIVGGGGALSAGLEGRIRAAIFSQVRPSDKVDIYDKYISCITSQKEMDDIIASLPVLRDKLRTIMQRDKYPAGVIDRIAAYFDREQTQLMEMHLVSARETRRLMVADLVRVVIEQNGNLQEFSPLMSVETKPRWAAAGDLTAFCRQLGMNDDPICSTELRRVSSSPRPCDLIDDLMSRTFCEMRKPGDDDGLQW